MAKTTRKVFLRQSTAEDLGVVLAEVQKAQLHNKRASQHLEAAVAKLQAAITLAESRPAPGYRPMPTAIRRRLKTLEAKAQETLEAVKRWAITQDEKVLNKAGNERGKNNDKLGNVKKPGCDRSAGTRPGRA